MFQSTLPVKGETWLPYSLPPIRAFQSTLPVKGETRGQAAGGFGVAVSIHSPRKGRDIREREAAARVALFQSTLPVKGETGAPPGEPLER